MAGVRSRLAVAIACGFLAAALVIVAAYLTSVVVARVFVGGATVSDVAAPLAVLALLAAVRAPFLLLADLAAGDASRRLKRGLREDLTGHLLALGPAYTSRERSGELAGVIGDGLASLDAYVASFQPARALAVGVPLMVLAAVLLIDPPTTLVLLFTGPILVLLLAVIGGRARSITERRFAEIHYLGAFFLDMLQGLPTLKMFGRSREQVANIRTISRQYGETTMDVLRTAFQTSLALEWGGAIAVALVAVEVSLRLIAGTIEFERALAVLIIVPEFFLPLRTLASRYHAGAAGRTVAERVFAILDVPLPVRAGAGAGAVAPASAGTLPRVEPAVRPAMPPPAVPLVAVPPTADLRFAGVSVTYPGRDRPALDRLDLTIPHGQVVAVVGATGAGKSTVASLLLRFIEPDDGSIVVGGIPLAAIEEAVWRAHLAWVPQRPHLFHGTVAENIRLAKPGATDEAVREAARDAGADAFIASLPGGYETAVGENGARLSGGQRQRIAIARAFLADAPLVVLDEVTSHLDPESEAVIAAAVARLARHRTVLIVSHRLRLVSAADLVVVLDHGRVVESGRPADLALHDGPFSRLVASGDAEPGRDKASPGARP